MEEGMRKVAMQFPSKLPTEKQHLLMLEILAKGRLEGGVLTSL